MFGGLLALYHQQVRMRAWLEELLRMRQDWSGHLERQEDRQQHFGLLLERRLAAQDAHAQHLFDLKGQISSLTRLMSHDAHRGAYGEMQLIHLLSDMFPKHLLRFQHVLANQRRVDAALWLESAGRWLCMDAKFPLEDFDADLEEIALKRFKQKLKKHINDIRERYYVPSETMEVSILFLPAEGLFLWVHQKAYDLIQYAHSQQVWLASPSTLPALLHILLSVMKDHQVTQMSKEFIKEFQQLLALVSAYERSLSLLEKSFHHHQQHLWQLLADQRGLREALSRIARVQGETLTEAELP